jgi:hypothetical protein
LFNLLSFGVYGTIGNALSLTKKSWLNMKQETSVAPKSGLSKGLEGAIKRPEVGGRGSIQGSSTKEYQEATTAGARLSCQLFGWISSWKPSTSLAPHGERDTLLLNDLQEHLKAMFVHVVMG